MVVVRCLILCSKFTKNRLLVRTHPTGGAYRLPVCIMFVGPDPPHWGSLQTPCLHHGGRDGKGEMEGREGKEGNGRKGRREGKERGGRGTPSE